MKYFVEVSEGRSFEIDVYRKGESEFRLVLDGREIEADFLAVDRLGQYAARIGNKSLAPSIEELDQQHLLVTVGRRSFRVFATDEREHAASAISENVPKSETLLAPMPGIVAEIHVKVGDHIEPGQCVLIMEAMKMQNEICAKHGGVVEAVLIAAGQSVSGNERLVLISNDEDEDNDQ